MKRRRRVGTGVAYGIALLATLISLFPLYWLFVISTKTPRDAFATPPQLIYVPDFSKYFEVWNTAGFANAFMNSIQVVLLGVALTLVVATPAAYAALRFRIRGGRYMRFWLLLAYTTPEFLFVIPMYVAYQQLGLYDTVVGLAVIYQVFAIPFAVWLIQSFLSEVPKELGDVRAQVDDPAPAALHHPRRQPAHGQEGGLGHDVEVGVPIILAAVDDGPVQGDPGIVDEDVDTAERLDGAVAHGMDLVGPGQVADQRDRSAAQRLDVPPRPFGRRRVEVVDGHIRPGAGEAQGDPSPDTPAGSGHQCPPAGQVDRFAHFTAPKVRPLTM